MKHKLLAILLLSAVALWAAVWVLPDNNLHVIVCDVGQGDGILITHRTTQLLVDMGPDASITECLAEYMPFYDKTIEAAIITHPQQDHMGGFPAVTQSYTLMHLFIPPVRHSIRVYDDLMASFNQGQFKVTNLYTQDAFSLGPMEFRTIWPSKDFLVAHAVAAPQVLGWTSDKTDLNSYGITGVLTFGEFDVLLTADTDHLVQPAQVATGLLRPVEVLKAPHHGGKQSIIEEWLAMVDPQVAVISVGRDNRYDHPRAETLDILRQFGIQIFRTDTDGAVEIVSDGSKYWRAQSDKIQLW